MPNRGAKRKHHPSIPAHIDQAGLPTGVYWDKTGNGRWYTFVLKEGRPSRETIAGPNARNSDLHRYVEEGRGGPPHGTINWMLARFHDSTHFKGLAAATKRDYENCRAIVENFPTKLGIKVGALVAARLSQPNVQSMHEKIVNQGTPSKANHVLRYLRGVYKWAGPHLGIKDNPARGILQAKERQRRRLPSEEVYAAVVAYARHGAGLKAHSKGSVAPYLWAVAEIGYLCRLRGIETNTLVEAQGEEAGLRTDRRKGSQNNIVEWSPRLRTAWDALLANRAAVIKRRHQPEQIHAERRYLVISENGEPLTKSGLDSAWQRLIASCVENKIITEEQRFSLHDLKRKGGTDTSGTKADKQQALGVTEAMMKVYDHSLAIVKPSDMP